MPVTGGAGDGLRARLGASTAARFAGDQRRHPDARLLAFEGFLERDLHVVAEVVATRGALLTPARAHEVAEHLVEDVGEARGKAEIARPAAAVLEGSMTEAVIGRALLLVLQDVISLADVLEFLFRRLVPGIAVGVPLHGELAVGFLQILGAAALRYPQQLVEVLLSHR